MYWSASGAMALAVIFGAYGVHGLSGRIDAHMLSVYNRAEFYHFVHALGILIVAQLPQSGALSRRAAGWVCGLLLAGIVLFSGSLYALVISGYSGLDVVTPFGGLSFIAAWALLAWALVRKQERT